MKAGKFKLHWCVVFVQFLSTETLTHSCINSCKCEALAISFQPSQVRIAGAVLASQMVPKACLALEVIAAPTLGNLASLAKEAIVAHQP